MLILLGVGIVVSEARQVRGKERLIQRKDRWNFGQIFWTIVETCIGASVCKTGVIFLVLGEFNWIELQGTVAQHLARRNLGEDL